MKENKDCVVLCRAVYDQGQMRQFAERIDEDYRVDWCACSCTHVLSRPR